MVWPPSSDTWLEDGLARTATWRPFAAAALPVVPVAAADAVLRLTTVTTSS